MQPQIHVLKGTHHKENPKCLIHEDKPQKEEGSGELVQYASSGLLCLISWSDGDWVF